jgi:hypothetical protein
MVVAAVHIALSFGGGNVHTINLYTARSLAHLYSHEVDMFYDCKITFNGYFNRQKLGSFDSK